MTTKKLWQTTLFAATALATGTVMAHAQTAPAPAEQPAAPAAAPAAADAPPPGLWIDGIHLSAQFDAGFNINPSNPGNGLNFGQAFTDHANQATLDQVLLTANKPLDPKNSGFQWGFKLQGMYGSDARWTQYMGEFNNTLPGERYQFDVVEANILFHLPVLTDGGLDVKLGQYSTPLGFETIDPSTNPFYSHSYIFQWGLPYEHTGGLVVAHVNDTLDLYGGLDTGTNTTFGPHGDNNSALGGIGGFNLTLMGGNLTILALTHAGPDQSTLVVPNADGYWRYYNDAVITYKASDALTLVTELNWVRDDYGFAKKTVNAFGAAEYAAYTLTDTLTLNGRAEIFRDDNNFFVASFAGNNDPVRAEQGLALLSPVYVAPGGNTTYGELTAGVTWKPPVPDVISGLLIRPEVRWDHALTGNNPFNQNKAGKDGTNDNFTIAADAVLTF